MPSCLISLGANLGNRCLSLDQAIRYIGQHDSIELVAASTYHRTQPAGGPDGQGEFLNAAVRCETSLSPECLLALLFAVEEALGRLRIERWAPRRIDLDLLLYDELAIHTDSLILPHPRMAFRRFVLAPAVEIAAQMVHPHTGWTIAKLLDHLDHAPNYVAITGAANLGKTLLARGAAAELDVEFVADPMTAQFKTAQFKTGHFEPGHFVTPNCDQAGLDLATELEFLRQRTQRLLRHASQPRLQGSYSISDFWLDQSLAYSRLVLPSCDLDHLEATWHQLRNTVVRPKLLIALEDSCEKPKPRSSSEGRQMFCRELAAQMKRSAGAPTLTLSAADPEWAKAELKAAIAAME